SENVTSDSDTWPSESHALIISTSSRGDELSFTKNSPLVLKLPSSAPKNRHQITSALSSRLTLQSTNRFLQRVGWALIEPRTHLGAGSRRHAYHTFLRMLLHIYIALNPAGWTWLIDTENSLRDIFLIYQVRRKVEHQ